MQKTTSLLLLTLATLSLSGCVSLPLERLSTPVETAELMDHVNFLAQPALKGRKAGSWESDTVREYLAGRFADYGLLPWPGVQTYEQDFAFGTNMIAILPGTDPDLADEIVILSAHYDHVGKGRKGIYPGACDNASGVAALLEIAEQMTLADKGPKRSVCFASFDTEERMAFGAFAFTLSKAFEGKKIAAVVNIDMLGRDFLDIIENSLFVIGTENYPQLRAEIMQKAQSNDLQILPLSTELTGPAGDHLAFEHLDIPVLFFSCGYNKDYHATTDTPEKIDYETIKKSADLIAHTVGFLADSKVTRVEQPGPDDAQLRTLSRIAEVTGNNAGLIGLDDPQAAILIDLAEEASRALTDKNRSQRDQHYLGTKIIAALAPAIEATSSIFEGTSEESVWRHAIYADHSKFLIDSYRDMAKSILAKKTNIFQNLDFKYRTCNITHRNISFVQNDRGLYELDILVPKIGFFCKTKGFLFKSGHFVLHAHWTPLFFEGTKEQATDYCLLQWRKDAEDTECAESYHNSWTRVLKTITGEDLPPDYDAWLEWWTEKQGHENQQQWLDYLAAHEHLMLAAEATLAKGPEHFCKRIEDPNTPTIQRHLAINLLTTKVTKEMLLSLAKIVDDKAPLHYTVKPRYWPITAETSYPFADHIHARQHRAFIKSILYITTDTEDSEEPAPEVKTVVLVNIGDIAEIALEKFTQQQFKKDKSAWKKWIEENADEKNNAPKGNIFLSASSIE